MTVKTIVLEVIGENEICCATCENTISQALEQLSGVRQVVPNHKTQSVELRLDTGQTTHDSVRESLSQIGWQTREPAADSG